MAGRFSISATYQLSSNLRLDEQRLVHTVQHALYRRLWLMINIAMNNPQSICWRIVVAPIHYGATTRQDL